MIVFVDASVVIAILGKEADAFDLIDSVAGAEDVLWSAMSRWESIVGLCRSYKFSPSLARDTIDDFGKEYRFRLVPIAEHENDLAFEAYRVYGKGHHPAALNMGDCFAYACAKANDALLLYKGNDFARTDLA